jgi:hypothetical protein
MFLIEQTSCNLDWILHCKVDLGKEGESDTLDGEVRAMLRIRTGLLNVS